MGKTIYNVKLTDLLPESFTSDPDIAAKCAALDAMSAMVTTQIGRVIVLADIGNQSSEVTDLLAVEQRTPYYDQSLSLEARRALLKNTGKLNSIKGTKGAVETALKSVFGSGIVQEWFEYGGDPYYFRVLLYAFPSSESQMDKIRAAVAATQNERSYLEDIIIIVPTTIAQMYIAGVTQVAVTVNTRMRPPV